MRRIRALWHRGWAGKAIISLVGLVVVCCVIGLFTRRPRVAPVASVATPVLAAVVSTDAPIATSAPAPTAAPVAAATADDRYLAIARQGALPTARSGASAGSWVAKAQDLGHGIEVQITFPMTIGFSNDQTVRQAQLQGVGILKRLFDADADLARINVIGTLPDGPDSAELAAVAIVLERAAYTAWNGDYATLPWNVSPRLK